MRLSVLKFTENSTQHSAGWFHLSAFLETWLRMFAPNSYETGFKMFQTALREAVVGCCGALCLALTTHEIRDTRSSRHPQLSTAEATAMPCLCCPARYHCQLWKICAKILLHLCLKRRGVAWSLGQVICFLWNFLQVSGEFLRRWSPAKYSAGALQIGNM